MRRMIYLTAAVALVATTAGCYCCPFRRPAVVASPVVAQPTCNPCNQCSPCGGAQPVTYGYAQPVGYGYSQPESYGYPASQCETCSPQPQW